MKAILKYRLKAARPALIAGLVILVASIIALFVDFGTNTDAFGTFYMHRMYNNTFVLPIILILFAVWLGLILTAEYGDKNTEDFFSGLPVKKKDRFLVSVMLGLGVLLVMGIISIIAVCISHNISFAQFAKINLRSEDYDIIVKLDGLGNAIARMAQMYMFAFFFYFIAVFAGVSGRDKKVAVLIIVLVLFFALVFGEIIGVFEKLFSIEMPLIKDLIEYGSCYQLLDTNVNFYINDTIFVCYENLLESIIVAGVMTVVFAVSSFLMATVANRDYGKIVIGKNMEKLFIAIIGIYAAGIIPMLLDYSDFDIGIVLVVMAAVFALIVFVLYKLIYKSKKYSHLNAGEGKQNEN